MELDDKQIKEIEDRVCNRVLEELNSKYYFVPKEELEGLTNYIKDATERLNEKRRKMSASCGCSGAGKPKVETKTEKSETPKNEEEHDDTPQTEGEPDKPNLREAWKVDEPIYEFEPPSPGDPTIFSILKYVTLNLVWHIDTIYNVHYSLLNIESWILGCAIPVMEYLSKQPVTGIVTTNEGYGPMAHVHSVVITPATVANTPAVALTFSPMPRFISPISPPEGPAHYYIGNAIPET